MTYHDSPFPVGLSARDYTVEGVFDSDPLVSWQGAVIRLPAEERSKITADVDMWTARLAAEGVPGGHWNARGGGFCDHCGEPVRFVVVVRHAGTGPLLAVGTKCVGPSFEQQVRPVTARLKGASATARQAVARQLAQEAWMAEGKGRRLGVEYMLQQHAAQHAEGYDGVHNTFVDSMYERWMGRKGNTVLLSDNMVAVLVRNRDRKIQEDKLLAARTARGVKAPTGPHLVSGVVVDVHTVENKYGLTVKMIVDTQEGFQVRASVPAALLRQVSHADQLKDRTVSFEATLEPWEADPTIADGKRPQRPYLVPEEA
jgi:hypothetical protein